MIFGAESIPRQVIFFNFGTFLYFMSKEQYLRWDVEREKICQDREGMMKRAEGVW